jgi:hypothetical protein
VIDRDHIDQIRHSSIRLKAFKHQARFYTIRTVAELNTTLLRVLSGEFDEAPTRMESKLVLRLRNGTEYVDKVAELMSRAPLHYVFNQSGRKPIQLRTLPYRVFATVDTTHRTWRAEVRKIARHIKRIS